MPEYHKLVRDKIPQIIQKQGKKFSTRILTEKEFRLHLHKKLEEEVKEYLESPSPEELADILEVVFALGEVMDCPEIELHKLRKSKQKSRGGFKLKIFLEQVED